MDEKQKSGKENQIKQLKEVEAYSERTEDINPETLTPSYRAQLGNLLNNQVEEFLRNGGEIEQIPSGVSGECKNTLTTRRRYWKEINFRKVMERKHGQC